MHRRGFTLSLSLSLLAAALVYLTNAWAQAGEPESPSQARQPWRGVHIMAPSREDLPLFERAIEQGLKPLGINAIILEVNFRFDYKSHPELSDRGSLTRHDARSLSALCKRHGIRLIPQFSSLGHQSWSTTTFPLLKKYPQFDETPDLPADNKGIYCRSWCASNPDVYPVVYALIDELVEAFDADAFHVGMDEVFLIGSEHCVRCRGKDTASLFAKAVNDLHRHIVGDKRLTMMMWADRLLDGKATGYGKWEASENGTQGAADLIPKDIVMCDWHYEKRANYPSVSSLQQKGFRVWPASWKDPAAALAFLEDARRGPHDLVVGHLGTTWVDANEFCRALLDPKAGVGKNAAASAETLRVCMKALDKAARERWISLFNGKNLEGWIPKLKGSVLGENYKNTFRVQDGLLKVSYDQYTDFKGEFGHLFYKSPYSSYRLRVEYRFVGDQVAGGPGWAFRNSGVMIHGQSPESMGKDQDFPVSIEVQFLGGTGKGMRPTANLCTPGTNVVMDGKLITQHCTESKSKTIQGDEWVSVEVEAHGNGTIKHFVDGELVLHYEKPQLDPADKDAKALIKAGRDLMLHGGYLSLQAESHPVEFRRVEILPLED